MSTHNAPDQTTPSPEQSQLAASPSDTPGEQTNHVTDQLRITYGPIEAGCGHRGMPVIFTNVGPSMCRLSGYPKVTALNTKGEPVVEAQPKPSGYLGGLRSGSSELPIVDLLPGQSASAIVEAMAFNISDGGACTAYASMMVTPPGGSQAVSLEWECDGGTELQVHPVVPGEEGQQP